MKKKIATKESIKGAVCDSNALFVKFRELLLRGPPAVVYVYSVYLQS